MSTPLPPLVVPTAAPWYTSPVQKANIAGAIAALVTLSPKLGQVLGIASPGAAATWVETVFGFITLVAPILGGIWRARSKLQPLTLTQKAADAHPANIAAAAAVQASTGDPHAKIPVSSGPS